MGIQSKFEKVLGINNENDGGVWIKSTRTLRHLIGILGMALPLLLIVFSPDCDSKPIESISHYFYTRSGTFFVVIMSLIAFFLIIYTKDFIWSSIAGICALFVVFFPTTMLVDNNSNCAILSIPENELRETFHLVSAAIFLLILAFMAIFSFTKRNEPNEVVGRTKVICNWVYRLCGIIMIVAMLIIVLGFYTDLIPRYHENNLTFWMETLALELFGIAWLIKGRTSH